MLQRKDELAREMTQRYFDDTDRIGIGRPDAEPTAVGTVDAIIALIADLIEQDHAFVLFNYVGTPTVTRTLPLLKRYEKREVLLLCPFTGAEPQRRPPYDEFVFNLRASYGQETAGLVKQFVEVGRKRIGVFYQIDAYGRSGWEGVRDALTADGPLRGPTGHVRGARGKAGRSRR